MKVLIVYEQIDEQSIKAIVEMTTNDYEFFKDVNEYFVNFSEFDVQK